MKKLLLVLALTLVLASGAFAAMYTGTYYMWESAALYQEHNINKAVVKIQEDVWDYSNQYDPNNPGSGGVWGEFLYQYQLTNLYGPGGDVLTSFAFIKAHKIEHAQALTPGWNIYPNWSPGIVNANAPANNGGLQPAGLPPMTAIFNIWINDLYGAPNDADHGYVNWALDFNWQHPTKPYKGSLWNYGTTLYGDKMSAPVPEPGTLLLLGSGLLGFGIAARIRRKRS